MERPFFSRKIYTTIKFIEETCSFCSEQIYCIVCITYCNKHLASVQRVIIRRQFTPSDMVSEAFSKKLVVSTLMEKSNCNQLEYLFLNTYINLSDASFRKSNGQTQTNIALNRAAQQTHCGKKKVHHFCYPCFPSSCTFFVCIVIFRVLVDFECDFRNLCASHFCMFCPKGQPQTDRQTFLSRTVSNTANYCLALSQL